MLKIVILRARIPWLQYSTASHRIGEFKRIQLGIPKAYGVKVITDTLGCTYSEQGINASILRTGTEGTYLVRPNRSPTAEASIRKQASSVPETRLGCCARLGCRPRLFRSQKKLFPFYPSACSLLRHVDPEMWFDVRFGLPPNSPAIIYGRRGTTRSCLILARELTRILVSRILSV